MTPGTLAQDLACRDFTINAMAMPIAGGTGDIIDPHGGRADLDSGLIRVLHEASFRDNPTRIFRAVRYEARFGFVIEPDTVSLVKSALEDGAVGLLSGDRVRHELERMLNEEDPGAALRRAGAPGVLATVHPQDERGGPQISGNSPT